MRIIAQRDGNCGVLNKAFDGFRGQKIEVFMRDGECIVAIDGEEFEVCEGLPLEIVVSSDYKPDKYIVTDTILSKDEISKIKSHHSNNIN